MVHLPEQAARENAPPQDAERERATPCRVIEFPIERCGRLPMAQYTALMLCDEEGQMAI